MKIESKQAFDALILAALVLVVLLLRWQFSR